MPSEGQWQILLDSVSSDSTPRLFPLIITPQKERNLTESLSHTTHLRKAHRNSFNILNYYFTKVIHTCNFLKRFYLFIFRKREKERKRNIEV